jgi:tyrosinase
MDDVASVLDDTDFASFSDRLEQLHDDVHVWVGGDMRQVTTAAYDPLFFAHHCMIDRIWYLWQVRHGNGGVPNALLDLELIPFGKRFRDVLDVQALGYEYAATTVPIPAGGQHG